MNILKKIYREIFLKEINEFRYILERDIFPGIKGQRILFVGVNDDTKNYQKILSGNDFYTIDKKKLSYKYGANKHITGKFEEIDNLFNKKYFDIIFLIGVFGYGTNRKENAEKIMLNCYNLLKDDGIVILSWTDIKKRNKIKPRELNNFKLFKPISICRYPSQYRTQNNNIFEFLIKNLKGGTNGIF